MSKHNIKIKLGELGFGTIELDGTDISDAIQGTEIEARAGQLTRVTLDLGLVEVQRLDAEKADVLISPDAHDALVALGWSPPVDEENSPLAEARMWARHGYEIAQRSCTWADHGVAPTWLTEDYPPPLRRPTGDRSYPPVGDPDSSQVSDMPPSTPQQEAE